MLEMAGNWVVCQGLYHASLESITEPLEGALRESVRVKGTVKTSCSPESCSADSASLSLWSYCHSDDMHGPLGIGLRVSLIWRMWCKAGLGERRGNFVLSPESIPYGF